MSERQNIEWKRSWQDEYLKWICGFANAPHASVPRNRLIADICFKAGYIDSWGHGIEKITNTCTEHGCPTPNFDVAIAEMAKQITPTGVLVILAPKFSMAPQVTQQDGTSQAPVTAPVEQAHEDQVGTKSASSRNLA